MLLDNPLTMGDEAQINVLINSWQLPLEHMAKLSLRNAPERGRAHLGFISEVKRISSIRVQGDGGQRMSVGVHVWPPRPVISLMLKLKPSSVVHFPSWALQTPH